MLPRGADLCPSPGPDERLSASLSVLNFSAAIATIDKTDEASIKTGRQPDGDLNGTLDDIQVHRCCQNYLELCQDRV